MFLKLSRYTTAWWVCIAATCVLGASLLTVLVYPVYAHHRTAICNRDRCGLHNGCGPCGADDGLGANGGYEIEATVNGHSHWEDNNQCWGQARTYHRTEINNESGGRVRIDWRYKALFFQPHPHQELDCGTHPPHPPLNPGWFHVDHGETRTNTYTQAQNYRLGVPNDCSYATKALTEVIFATDNTDAQAADPVFLACPDD